MTSGLNIILVFIASLILVLLGFLVVWMKRLVDSQGQKEELDLEKLVDQVFGKSVEKIAKQSKRVLESDRETIKVDLENKHKQLEKLVSRIESELERRDRELVQLEKARSQQFGELKRQLEDQRRVSERLEVSTRELQKVLASNQKRGAWGERIIEDLLESSGLIKGTHWVAQTKLGKTEYRPDITLLLPHDRVVPVDVKFPFTALQGLSTSDDKETRKRYKDQFKRDVKTKVDQVAKYISPESGTLDYAILFVPNEAVFAYINQDFPEMVDYAISKRVLMVSPISFLIVARTVMESYRNFMLADNLRGVLKHIDEFISEWDKFKSAFEKYGNSIASLQKSYEQLAGTRVRVMERKVGKVKEAGGTVLLEEKSVKSLKS